MDSEQWERGPNGVSACELKPLLEASRSLPVPTRVLAGFQVATGSIVVGLVHVELSYGVSSTD